MGILEQKLNTVTVPDQSGKKDSIDYDLSNIKVADIKIPTGTTTIDQNIGLSLTVYGVSAQVTADWTFRESIWPHIPNGKGDAVIDLSSITLNIVTSFGLTPQGKPTISAHSVSVDIGDIAMHFSGSHLDFILNLLKGLFEGTVKNDITQALIGAITAEVNINLNAQLATLNTEVNINNIAQLDLSLTGPITFPSTQYFVLPQHGEFYSLTNPVEAPYSPSRNLPSSPRTLQMLQMYVDQYVANTFAYSFFKMGKIQLIINANEVPSDSPIQLNTSTWQALLPNLYSKYPNWLMRATVEALTPPVANVSTSGAFVSGTNEVLIQVINPSNPNDVRNAFILGLNLTGAATASVVGNKIVANITSAKSSLGLISTTIGPINTVGLSAVISYLVTGAIIPQVNVILAQGIPIPKLDGLDAVNPSLQFGNGYVFVRDRKSVV